MSPIFQDKKSVDLMYFQKSDAAICGSFLPRNKQKAIFLQKTVIFILCTCFCFVDCTEVSLQKIGSRNFFYNQLLFFFNLWKEKNFWVQPRNVIHITEIFLSKIRINTRKSANGGILLWKSGNYLVTSFRALSSVFVRLSAFIVGTCWTKVQCGCYQEEN